MEAGVSGSTGVFGQKFADGVIAKESVRTALLERMSQDHVRFLRLMFSDIQGHSKNVEVPEGQFAKALRGEIMFDGSSIDGFSRIEESDMLLVPDLDSYVVFPFDGQQGKEARLICDVYKSDHTPFDGCPRLTLKRIVNKMKAQGLHPVTGPEVEFFLFERDHDGNPTTKTHDAGGYFDLLPIDRGEECRRDIVNALESMGFEIEAAHHEVAPGQHEIDFKYSDALESADSVMTFKMIVKMIALDYGLHATFMPKPIFGENGSGMHVHQSLLKEENGKLVNAFYDPEAEFEIGSLMRMYIAGILKHARAYVAITNPTVNSYKRLVPGYEAPVNVAWSEHNRSPLARVPSRRGEGTRVEVRIPDPSCNPYLAFATMLAAGFDGIQNELELTPPVNKNIFNMSQREKSRLKITQLPANLGEAIVCLRKSKVMRDALGEHVFNQFVEHKEGVWAEYITQVHDWELQRYLATH
jgi:glutamine synthetase